MSPWQPASRDFDADYRLEAQHTGGVQSLGFERDGAGNITALTDGIDPTRSQGIDYDALDRLVSATGLYGSRGYAYDAVGNRTAITRETETDTYTIDPASNRLAHIAGLNAKVYDYDAAGNTFREYVYLDGERLAVLLPGGDASLTFDGELLGIPVPQLLGIETAIPRITLQEPG